MTSPDDFSLLEDYLHGQLPPEEAAEVERRLLAEPALAHALILLSREEAILTRWAHAAEFVGRGARPVPRRRRRAAVLLAAACLAVCATVTLWWLGRSPDTPAPPAGNPGALARVEEMQGEVVVVEDSRRSPAQAGQWLRPGQWLQTIGEGSFAVLRYADQTRLELGTGTRVHLLTGPPEEGEAGDPAGPVPPGKQVFLAEGTVAAETPAAAEDDPMIVTTPHAEVRGVGARFVSASAEEATRIDLESGTARLTRRSDGESVEIRPHSYAVAGAQGGPLRTRPLPRRLDTPRATFLEEDGPVLALDYHPRGTVVAVGGWKGRITLWDPAQPDQSREIPSLLERIHVLAFSPDGALLAACGPGSGSRHARITLLDPTTGKHLGSLEGMHEAKAFAFRPDGKVLAALGTDHRGKPVVVFWDVGTRAERSRISPGPERIGCLAFAPDGRTLATGGVDGKVTLWNGETGEKQWEMSRGDRPIRAIAFHPKGARLVAGGHDGIVTFHEADTGEKVRTLPGPLGEVRSVAFAPDGKLLAAATPGPARLWDVATGKELTTVKGHRYATTCVRFSPDGGTLATAGWDRSVHLWDLVVPARPDDPAQP